MVSAGLLILWLLLNQTFSLGHILLGAGAGLVGGWALAALDLPKARLRRLGAICPPRGLWYLADIVRSNVAVARIVLGFGRRERNFRLGRNPARASRSLRAGSARLHHHVHTRNAVGRFRRGERTLTIHVLDLVDESDWVRTIKGRYERLLLEILA